MRGTKPHFHPPVNPLPEYLTDALGVLGIDESALKKGQRDYAGIISACAANGELTL